MNNNCYIRINKSGSHSILRWLEENKISWNKFEIMKEQDYSKDRLYKAIDSSDLKYLETLGKGQFQVTHISFLKQHKLKKIL